MDYKLDYISRIFKKTSKKRIEHYVITRIWHRLNDPTIKIRHQQYVLRNGEKYALTDLFFPQLKYHVEVNEDFHYRDSLKEILDSQRIEEIGETTKDHIIKVIDCRGNLESIHKQIDDIVNELKEIISKQKQANLFRPWEEDELTPEYWMRKEVLHVKYNINLRTIDDIGMLFNVKIKSRGFLKPGAVTYKKNGFSEIWWPEKKEKNYWKNDFRDEFNIITEENADPKKAEIHLAHFLNKDPECKRIVFFKYKDELGFNFYKFVGCYHLNRTKSINENKVIWERFSQTFNLPTEIPVS